MKKAFLKRISAVMSTVVGNKSSDGTNDTPTSYPKFEEMQFLFLQKSTKPVESIRRQYITSKLMTKYHVNSTKKFQVNLIVKDGSCLKLVEMSIINWLRQPVLMTKRKGMNLKMNNDVDERRGFMITISGTRPSMQQIED